MINLGIHIDNVYLLFFNKGDSMDDRNLPEATQPESKSDDYQYDAQAALRKAGQIQDKIMDAVIDLPADRLFKDAKLFENVNSLLSNVNSTGTQVIRNSLVESNSNVGAVADAVIDRMAERGISLIKTVKDTGQVGRIPKDLDIEDADFEPIQEDMLVKGLVTTNYEEFAAAKGLNTE